MSKWIQTYTGTGFGRKMDILNPDYSEVTIEEIAIVLSRIRRFNGHTIEPYSVAQHCGIVAQKVAVELCGGWQPELLSPAQCDICLAALLHDAHEGFTGFGDVASPAKELCPRIKEIERIHDEAICRRFGLEPLAFQHPIIKQIDLETLAQEAQDLMEAPPEPWNIPAALHEPYIHVFSDEQKIAGNYLGHFFRFYKGSGRA